MYTFFNMKHGGWKSVLSDIVHKHVQKRELCQTYVYTNMYKEREFLKGVQVFAYEGTNSMELLMSGPFLAGN